MSDKQSSRESQRKPSANKNIKKLRTISLVSSLTGSWQQWATDNEEKQAGEPSGWSLSTLGGQTVDHRKKWVPKTPPAAQIQPTEGSQVTAPTSGEVPKTSAPQKKIEEPLVTSAIKTKQVVKTVTSKVQEKGAGIGLLTKMITREALPSAEEIDRLLAKKSSPTLRRKCSNMVSSLTKSWKKVEKEQKIGEEGARAGKSQTGGLDKEESGHPEEEDEAQTQTESDGEGDFESAVKIKRPSVPT